MTGKLARVKRLEYQAGRAAWEQMTGEERWVYLQELRAASPAFNRRFEVAEQRVKAMSDAELRLAAGL
ncbi:hypothetical protein Q0M94_27995 (plasmid) [Deinococcus radiomollis]|uniref:hypothetical protein n=1 Tax=Deinococcus radiomollis TaxID=468916 RepID=UPI0038919ED6